MGDHEDNSIHSDDNVSDIVDQSDDASMDASYSTNNNSDLANGNTSLSQLPS